MKTEDRGRTLHSHACCSCMFIPGSVTMVRLEVSLHTYSQVKRLGTRKAAADLVERLLVSSFIFDFCVTCA